MSLANVNEQVEENKTAASQERAAERKEHTIEDNAMSMDHGGHFAFTHTRSKKRDSIEITRDKSTRFSLGFLQDSTDFGSKAV
jgi:hypothetical protein